MEKFLAQFQEDIFQNQYLHFNKQIHTTTGIHTWPLNSHIFLG